MPGTTTDGDPIAAANSARPGPTTPSPTSPRNGSSAGPFWAASSANTSGLRRSPGQARWPSSGTPQALTVRAENRLHGSDQQSCSPGASPAMITGHVPAVPVPPDHSASRTAAAVPARGGVENRRDPDPAPPARGPAAAAAAPPEAELGGPGPARGTVRRDTQSPPPRIAAAGHPGHHPALAPRHRPAPPGGAVHARQDRPAGPPPEHQGPRPPAGPGQPRMGLPQDPRRTGRPGSQDSGAGRLGDP